MYAKNWCNAVSTVRSFLRGDYSLFLVLYVLFTSVVLFVPFILFVFLSFGFRVHTVLAAVSTDVVTAMKSEIVVDTNEVRIKDNRTALVSDSALSLIAQRKAEMMASHGEFAHTLEDGTTAWSLMKMHKYSFLNAGENLAVDFTSSQKIVDAWYASPTHKANIVSSNYTSIGIGIAEGIYNGHKSYFIVQLFARQ